MNAVNWDTYWLYVLTEAALSLSPGPAVMLVTGYGLTLQLANPKTLIFFVAILPQFVDPRLPIGAQMAWLAAGSVVPEFFILAGYGFLASRAARIATDPRYARFTDRIAGALVLAAAALVLSVAPT